jgi:hypothetical protein
MEDFSFLFRKVKFDRIRFNISPDIDVAWDAIGYSATLPPPYRWYPQSWQRRWDRRKGSWNTGCVPNWQICRRFLSEVANCIEIEYEKDCYFGVVDIQHLIHRLNMDVQQLLRGGENGVNVKSTTHSFCASGTNSTISRPSMSAWYYGN